MGASSRTLPKDLLKSVAEMADPTRVQRESHRVAQSRAESHELGSHAGQVEEVRYDTSRGSRWAQIRADSRAIRGRAGRGMADPARVQRE